VLTFNRKMFIQQSEVCHRQCMVFEVNFITGSC